MKNRKHYYFLNTILIFIIFLGILMTFYAPVSKHLAKKRQSEVTLNYSQDVSTLSDEVIAQEWAKAKEYNDILAGKTDETSYLAGSGKWLPANYYNILNINGVMGTLKIPKIKLELPIYHGTDEGVLRKGVGHIFRTAMPIGGEGNHCVLTAHRGLIHAELFTHLDKLAEGDIFYLEVLGTTLSYEVDQVTVTEPENLSPLLPAAGKDYVSLVTCTPYGYNSHRLMVRGVRTEYLEENSETVTEETESGSWWCVIAGFILGFLLLLLLIRRRKKRNH